MAISVQHSHKSKDCDDSVVSFFCDTEDDVSALPTQSRNGKGLVVATGSTATVLKPATGKSTYRVLASSGEWVEAPQTSGGGSAEIVHPIVIDCGTPSTH